MLKKAAESNQAIFDDRFGQTSLHQVITFTVLHNPKLKLNPLGLCGKVYKTSDIVKQAVIEEFSKMPDFIIVINEEVFDRLDYNSQILLADKLFAQMGFDFEKDQTQLIAPDVQEYSGILKKYNFSDLEALKLSIESIYEKMEEEASSDKPKKRGRKKISV